MTNMSNSLRHNTRITDGMITSLHDGLPEIRVSIIIPVYCNEGSLEELYRKLVTMVIEPNPAIIFNTIFVDDGSKDDSYNVLKKLKNIGGERVKIIKLTRNFGQLGAIKAGLDTFEDDYAVLMTADLQDPPELINDMLDMVRDDKIDIVVATRTDRDESWYRVYTSRLFYGMMRRLTFKNMPIGGFDYLLMSNRVVDFIRSSSESNQFMQGHILYSGFPISFIPYRRKKRMFGTSKWTFGKKVKLLIDGILAYSYFPVRLMTVTGFLTSLIGFVYAIIIVVSYFYNGTPFKGWAPIMIVVLVLSGVQMLMIGIIGEYLWRTLDQVRHRPAYVVEEIL